MFFPFPERVSSFREEVFELHKKQKGHFREYTGAKREKTVIFPSKYGYISEKVRTLFRKRSAQLSKKVGMFPRRGCILFLGRTKRCTFLQQIFSI